MNRFNVAQKYLHYIEGSLENAQIITTLTLVHNSMLSESAERRMAKQKLTFY
nr:hypothetical protein [uncultured Psychroserpens sp.]